MELIILKILLIRFYLGKKDVSESDENGVRTNKLILPRPVFCNYKDQIPNENFYFLFSLLKQGNNSSTCSICSFLTYHAINSPSMMYRINASTSCMSSVTWKTPIAQYTKSLSEICSQSYAGKTCFVNIYIFFRHKFYN